MKKNIYLLAAIVLVSSCGKGPKDARGDAPIECAVVTVDRADRILKSEYAASIQGCQIVEVRPQVSGTISRICISEGDAVRKGQILFVIDQVPYKAELEVAKANVASAQAKVEAARLTLQSQQQLYERKVVSEYDLQMAKSNVATAEASLAQAKAQQVNAANELSYTEVKSPVDGKAGMIPYRVGALVSSSIATPLVTVSDDSEVFAYFSMNEKSVLDMMSRYESLDAFVASAPEVEMVLANGKPYSEPGHIGAISGIVDDATGAVSVRADFTNAGHLLRNGSHATIVMPSALSSCMVIPQSATYEIQEKKFVFRVVDGIAHSTEVKVFRLNDGREYVVESGLNPGDVIVAEGAGLMKEGSKIVAKK